ncbi:MAG: hypothetical protein AAF557_25840 [Pseudomonadota bacterium]
MSPAAPDPKMMKDVAPEDVNAGLVHRWSGAGAGESRKLSAFRERMSDLIGKSEAHT